MKSTLALSFATSVLLACCLVIPVEVLADELSQKNKDLFEIHVRPTLVAHCIKCHGDTKQEGGLRLTSLTEILEGGDSGPAIVPGAPGESLMLEALRYESFEMPPDGRLEDQLISGMETWIAAGAPWPLGTVLTPIEIARGGAFNRLPIPKCLTWKTTAGAGMRSIVLSLNGLPKRVSHQRRQRSR
jgi:hypothetical protein